MAYISEEAVEAARAEAEAAQQEADKIANSASTTEAEQADWHKKYAESEAKAARLRVRAEGLAAARSRYETALATRRNTVSRMTTELASMLAAVQLDTDLLNERAQTLATALVKLQQAASNRNERLQEYASRLAGAGLFAVDNLTPEGEHHPSGARGGAAGLGIYLANEIFAPVEPVAISLFAVGAVFGSPGGGADKRLLYQLGRDALARGRLGAAGGFRLPTFNPTDPKPNGHKPPAADPKPGRTADGRFTK